MCFSSVYETRQGDTPSVIAKEQLGDCNRWREVVEWNLQKCGIMGPHDWYRVGTFLRLPEGDMDNKRYKPCGADGCCYCDDKNSHNELLKAIERLHHAIMHSGVSSELIDEEIENSHALIVKHRWQQ